MVISLWYVHNVREFSQSRASGCRSPLLQPFACSCFFSARLVVAVRESRHTMFRIIYNNNQILTYDKGLLPASWRAWTVLGDQLFGQPG